MFLTPLAVTAGKAHRRIASLAVVAAVVALVPEPAAGATTATPPLRLVTTGAVTAERLPGELVRLDPGTHVVAGSVPFEVRATRASYAEPIIATQLVHIGGRQRRVALPPGLLTDLAGFPAFFHMSVTDAAGHTVADRDETFCPGDAVRTRPDAPAASPYANRCSSVPFALGAVWGIQAGWGVSTARQRPSPLFLDDGAYTAVVSVNQPYRDMFGFPPDQSSATVRVTVRTVETAAATAKPGSVVMSRPTAASTVPKGPRPDLRALPAFAIHRPTARRATTSPSRRPCGSPARLRSSSTASAGPARM